MANALADGWLITLIVALPTIGGGLYALIRGIVILWRKNSKAEQKLRLRVEAEKRTVERELQNTYRALSKAEMQVMLLEYQKSWLEDELHRCQGQAATESG